MDHHPLPTMTDITDVATDVFIVVTIATLSSTFFVPADHTPEEWQEGKDHEATAGLWETQRV